uniref:DNA cross-link repair 1A protein n=1 Tax=Sphaeramia orbicularis TaxID=375764 RepID=A0A673AIY2_9TELE
MLLNDDSESDIWEYKPLGKKKKKQESASVSGTVAKKRCTSRKTSKKDTSSTVKSPLDKRCLTVNATGNEDVKPSVIKDEQNCLEALSTPSKTVQTDHNGEGPSSGDFCPICQMPFSILVVQSQRWHVIECLDFPRDTCKECPDGLLCTSTIPNHYKKYNHTFLAHSRATGDAQLLSLSQQATTSGDSGLGCLQGFRKADGNDSTLETSQESVLSVSVLSNNSASSLNNHKGTPPTKITNGLLLLRSPGPEDFKKKKGWSSLKGQKSLSSSQESKSDLSSTPAKTESRDQPGDGLLKSELSPYNDEAISYSPLSELPVETEVSKSEARKALFNSDTLKTEDDDSLMLYSDSFSSEDELFTEFLDNFETSDGPMKKCVLSDTQPNPFASSTQSNQQATSAVAANTSAPTREKEELKSSTSVGSACTNSIQSPQSIVLERLRETILNSDSLPFKNLDDSSIQSEKFQTMTPWKIQSKTGQASGLKQMDIGVFFGVKPLKEKEKEAKSGPREPSSASGETTGENSGQRRQRRERRGRSRATTVTSGDTVTGGNNEGDAQRESGRGGTRGWRRRRWNRGGADGEVEQLPRCPFYKKIPGTKFAIDAFRYGEIDGVTAYFLTHFHSDHYGGLRKNSTFPIYCNRITGNLVKSKLKVAEQYVHILPMNTQVTVEGVKVILLDANHCPGAAMLLFFLRDGQTVLHTGDFRADPSMETYPELLNCRVQTLYLDTTYCSPEYTFPKQQEVINYAANTAFELVTLNPRTLVVCGSYSVGKEKVFLALAEVLGSKVCLSRDKYNTMCCLESEQVRQRITTDWKAAQVHVLPMMQLSFKKLQDHLARFSGQYEKLVAFKPTGWTFSQQVDSVEDILPQTSGSVSIYGIPYSEHSSFLELKRFVQWLQPLKIIPTVNNGSWESRKAMERCFSEWIMETKAKL